MPFRLPRMLLAGQWLLLWGILWLIVSAEAAAQSAVSPPRQNTTAVGQHLRNSRQLLPLNPAAALIQGEQALHLAAVSGPPAEVGAAYLAIGAAYQAQRQYDPALRHFVRALRLYQQLHNEPGRARALRMLGRAQYLQGDTGQAYDTYKQALAITLSSGDARSRAQVYSNLGELLGAGAQWQRALRQSAWPDPGPELHRAGPPSAAPIQQVVVLSAAFAAAGPATRRQHQHW
jgi:two-component system, sensor histidine kinase and response regulator